MNAEEINAVVRNLYQRWGIFDLAPRTEAEMGKLLGISMGLGTIFNDNPDAERAWMNQYHDGLGSIPARAILEGRIDEVLAQVERERGLR